MYLIKTLRKLSQNDYETSITQILFISNSLYSTTSFESPVPILHCAYIPSFSRRIKFQLESFVVRYFVLVGCYIHSCESEHIIKQKSQVSCSKKPFKNIQTLNIITITQQNCKKFQKQLQSTKSSTFFFS